MSEFPSNVFPLFPEPKATRQEIIDQFVSDNGVVDNTSLPLDKPKSGDLLVFPEITDGTATQPDIPA